ncbi:Bifunctional protein HldE [archaeon HR06]|nr:Bifunctional protein HldE [archaeon HR06]
MVSLAIVGHLCLDYIVFKGRRNLQIGGPPFYCGITSREFGLKTYLITKFGPDFPYLNLLKDFKLSYYAKAKDLTTKFIHKIKGDRRTSQLLCRCEDIKEEQIEEFSFDSLLIDPVAQEVNPRIVKKGREKVGLMAMDPQGFLRRFSHNGYVYLGSLNTYLLNYIDIIKMDEEELNFIGSLKALDNKVTTLLVTFGRRGILFINRRRGYKIPVPKVKVNHPTGAGDITISSLVANFLKGEDPLYSACLSVACASLSMEREIKFKIPPLEKVKEVAEVLLQKVEKIGDVE